MSVLFQSTMKQAATTFVSDAVGQLGIVGESFSLYAGANMVVDWGDGEASFSGTGNVFKTYVQTGDKTIRLIPLAGKNLSELRFRNSGLKGTIDLSKFTLTGTFAYIFSGNKISKVVAYAPEGVNITVEVGVQTAAGSPTEADISELKANSIVWNVGLIRRFIFPTDPNILAATKLLAIERNTMNYAAGQPYGDTLVIPYTSLETLRLGDGGGSGTGTVTKLDVSASSKLKSLTANRCFIRQVSFHPLAPLETVLLFQFNPLGGATNGQATDGTSASFLHLFNQLKRSARNTLKTLNIRSVGLSSREIKVFVDDLYNNWDSLPTGGVLSVEGADFSYAYPDLFQYSNDSVVDLGTYGKIKALTTGTGTTIATGNKAGQTGKGWNIMFNDVIGRLWKIDNSTMGFWSSSPYPIEIFNASDRKYVYMTAIKGTVPWVPAPNATTQYEVLTATGSPGNYYYTLAIISPDSARPPGSQTLGYCEVSLRPAVIIYPY